MLHDHVLQVYSQRGVACETNVLHVWIQFHGALRARNAHITVYDVTTWSWVNLVHPPIPLDCRPCKLHRKSHDQVGRYHMGLGEKTASLVGIER